MAKFGEGDERWIVSERDDGRNVGGWHWEDKNVLPKVIEKCKQEGFLVGLQESLGTTGFVRITEASEITGEASCSTRKGGKVFTMFDLKITLKWEGCDSGDGEMTKGEMRITEFESTNEPEEYELKVVVTTKGSGDSQVKKVAESMKTTVLSLLHNMTATIAR